jgi:hypothetical protein
MDRQAAIRMLAYKWIRIIYRCWKDGAVYDETRYRGAKSPMRSGAALQQRTPLPPSTAPTPARQQAAAALTAPTVNLMFKPVAGFWKFLGVTP